MKNKLWYILKLLVLNSEPFQQWNFCAGTPLKVAVSETVLQQNPAANTMCNGREVVINSDLFTYWWLHMSSLCLSPFISLYLSDGG